MNIYIDESGIFANPANRRKSISVVGALTIPEKIERKVFAQYKRLLYRWGKLGSELKGKDLDEKGVSRIIMMLSKYKLLFTCSLIDLGLHRVDQIRQHKYDQADKIVERITEKHHPNLVRQLYELKERMAGISDPLYVQAQCLINVVADVIQNSVLYYYNNPKAIDKFSWTIDQKNETITEYEDLWKSIVCPMLQSYFLRQPLITINEGDYRYFDRFNNPTDTPHDHLDPYRKDPEGEFHSIDLKKIMLERLVFQDSSSSIGLQLADILVTTVRRACRFTLRKEGWKGIGMLMMHPLHRKDAINFLGFGIPPGEVSVDYKNIFAITNELSKSPFK